MLGLMYWFSTDVFSSENTRGVIESIIRWFNPHPSRHTLANVHYLIRKAAHFTEYGVLAVLLFRAFRADSQLRWRLSWFLYSLGIVVVWALLDELHQYFTRSRGASIYDSMLDTAGGLTALLILTLIYRRKQAVLGE
jgi:VanZ family protein